VPEVEFCFAAGFEAGDFLCSHVIPHEQLLGSGVVAADVEVAQQGGGGEPIGAKVVDEVDERVELALGDSDFYELENGLFGDADILGKQLAGLGFVDSVRKGLGRQDAVAVADGRNACGITIDFVAKPL